MTGACLVITTLTRSVGDSFYRLAGKLTFELMNVMMNRNRSIKMRVLAAETHVEMAAHSPARQMIEVRWMGSRPQPPASLQEPVWPVSAAL